MPLLYFPAPLPLSLRLLYCLAAAFGKTEAITSHQGRRQRRRPLHRRRRHSLGRGRGRPSIRRTNPFYHPASLSPSPAAMEHQSSAASAVISDVLDALKGKIAICLKSSPLSRSLARAPPLSSLSASHSPSVAFPSNGVSYPNMTSRV